MKVLTYMCENCFEPYVFNPSEKRNKYLCPKCGKKMVYFGTEEIDPNTSKVIKCYNESERKQSNPGEPIVAKPIICCPTCNSTKVKKISGTAKLAGAIMFGLFSKTAKSQFECKNCGYKW